MYIKHVSFVALNNSSLNKNFLSKALKAAAASCSTSPWSTFSPLSLLYCPFNCSDCVPWQQQHHVRHLPGLHPHLSPCFTVPLTVQTVFPGSSIMLDSSLVYILTSFLAFLLLFNCSDRVPWQQHHVRNLPGLHPHLPPPLFTVPLTVQTVFPGSSIIFDISLVYIPPSLFALLSL